MAPNSSLFLILVISISFSNAFILQQQESIKPLANWERVEIALSEIPALIINVGYSVIRIAAEDNYDATLVIAELMTAKIEQSMTLLGILELELYSRNLTVAIAKEHLGEVLVIITDYYGQIQPTLNELSDEAHEAIDQQFSYLFLGIPEMAQNVYDALEEPTPPSCGITVFSPNDTMTPDTPLDAWTPPGTTFWSGRVEDVQETFLLIYGHNKYLDSEVTTTFPKTLILSTSQDFPSFVGDTGLKVIQRTIMFQCYDGTTVTYKFGIDVNTDPIEEPTVKPVF